MSRRPLTGRADLVLALASEDAVTADVADRLGFEYIEAVVPVLESPLEAAHAAPLDGEETGPASQPAELYWRAETFTIRDVHRPPPLTPRAPGDDAETPIPVRLARFDPLATMAEAVTRLRQVADLTRAGSRLDVDRIVFELSRVRQLREFPRLNRQSWGQDLHIVIDLARRLTPYRRDQRLIGRAMTRLLPKGGGTVSVLREGSETPVIQWPEDQAEQELHVQAGATMLVLGDLGALQRSDSRAAEYRWTRIGKRLQDRECRGLALVPCRPDAVPTGLTRLWTLIPWERHGGRGPTPSSEMTDGACERILALLSPAARIEPRLLRAVRKLLPAGRRDPGLESIVWQMCQGTTHCAAAALTKRQAADLRERLAADDLRHEAWKLIEAAHREEYPGVACLEVVNLGDQAERFTSARSVEQSRQWFREIASGEAGTERRDDFFRRAAAQLTPQAWEAMPELHPLFHTLCGDDPPPEGFDPALAGVDAPLQTIQIRLLDDTLEYRRAGSSVGRSVPLAALRLKNPLMIADEFEDWPLDEDADPNVLWPPGQEPAWADRWGRDETGPWVEFAIDGARQRLRWIPPGRFLMGSPEDEQGRLEREGPQQPVTISAGFWMFDTPCTQGLWRTVMGASPSHFKGDQRPVERVSWEDCQQFMNRLDERCPGLQVELPTEAAWEYACRAGTKTSTYAGSRAINDAGHVPGLEEIAWYGANSGNETHDVGRKQPNAWGLYDMLGNVWEWCRDHMYRPYGVESVTDPLHVGGDASAPRVFRGGSWDRSARSVRAASRDASPPGDRSQSLGFRCSSSGNEPVGGGGQRPTAGRPGRRPGGVRSQRVASVSEREAEPREDREQASEDRAVRLTTSDAEYKPLPQAPIVRIRTDLEEVFLCQVTRPDWSSRAGRDRYGLWAEFSVPQEQHDDVIQRMRWVPPGRFLMGSPKSESGHYEDEAPQHEEVIAQGFWLFDTACTQSLWEVVMGKNPSKFKGKRRPVEQVSWNDCREFAFKLAELVPGLPLQLPGEAEWEYACRAGTDTSTYAGTFEVNDEASQDDLTRIAWYDRNSDSRTHDVGEKLPNPWGLYDMLGNVWEWCQDTWSSSYAVAREDDEPSALRVIRGGSWGGSAARDVRAACRSAFPPGGRSRLLGFRCSSSDEPGGR